MRAYYFIGPTGSEFLYIPLTLFSYRHIKDYDPRHNFAPEVLKKFDRAVLDGRINKYSLEKRDWKLEMMDIPDKMVNDFTNSCFRRRSKRRLNNRASMIFNWAFGHSKLAVESGLRDSDDVYDDQIEITHEGGYVEKIPNKEPDDLPEDTWWAEGTEPPF